MHIDTQGDWEAFLRLKSRAVDGHIPLPELEQVVLDLKAVAARVAPGFLDDEEGTGIEEYLATRRRAAELLDQDGGSVNRTFLLDVLERYARDKHLLDVADLEAYRYLLDTHLPHPNIQQLLPMLDAGTTIEEVLDAALAYEPTRL